MRINQPRQYTRHYTSRILWLISAAIALAAAGLLAVPAGAAVAPSPAPSPPPAASVKLAAFVGTRTWTSGGGNSTWMNADAGGQRHPGRAQLGRHTDSACRTRT